FTASTAGGFVVRAFADNSFTRVAESAPFSVGPPTVSTDGRIYTAGSTVTVAFSGLPGNAQDWIAIAPAGSDNTNYILFAFTNGPRRGSATFTAPANGSYVARAFSNNTFTLVLESAPFTVGTSAISTDQATYQPGATITVSYAGLPGNQKDWIAIA